MALPCVTKVPQAAQRIIKEASVAREDAFCFAVVFAPDFDGLNKFLIKLITK
jgi:hypothetical protein